MVESEPLRNQAVHPSQPGERVYGMCHVVFFRKPEAMARDQWLQVWQGSHTAVAIETQSTFGYRQNVVVRTLDAHSRVFRRHRGRELSPRGNDLRSRLLRQRG